MIKILLNDTFPGTSKGKTKNLDDNIAAQVVEAGWGKETSGDPLVDAVDEASDEDETSESGDKNTLGKKTKTDKDADAANQK